MRMRVCGFKTSMPKKKTMDYIFRENEKWRKEISISA